jgi:predicted transcriptional regulator
MMDGPCEQAADRICFWRYSGYGLSAKGRDSVGNPIQLTIPDDVYRQAQELARHLRQPVETVLVEALRDAFPLLWPVHPQRTQMQREEAAFDAMREALLATYPGQFVAIRNGQVVDHDAQELDLLQRVRMHHPDQLVLVREVTPTPPPPLQFRSPRLVRDG